VTTTPSAATVGGPAPYWQSYTYDALGDRVSETNHDTSVSSTANDVTQTLTYNGYNAATGASTAASQPGAVQSVGTAGPGGTTTSAYTYDAEGNTRTRLGQSFSYDAEGHTQSVTNTATNTTSQYLYGADGSLLIQRDPAASQVILYLPYGEELHLNTATATVSGLRYYTASPDGIVLVRSSSGSLTYELTDPRGTATTSVDASSLAVSRRYQDPYGNARGAAAPSWPDQHGYLGQPADPATGLSLLGARHYDSLTGRFLSVDPILEAGDHTQMNGYAYSGDDPVTQSDPTGLFIPNDPTLKYIDPRTQYMFNNGLSFWTPDAQAYWAKYYKPINPHTFMGAFTHAMASAAKPFLDAGVCALGYGCGGLESDLNPVNMAKGLWDTGTGIIGDLTHGHLTAALGTIVGLAAVGWDDPAAGITRMVAKDVGRGADKTVLYHGSPDFKGNQFDLAKSLAAKRRGTGKAGIYLTHDLRRAIESFGRDGQVVRTAVPRTFADAIRQRDIEGHVEYYVNSDEGVRVLNAGITDIVQSWPNAFLRWLNGDF